MRGPRIQAGTHLAQPPQSGQVGLRLQAHVEQAEPLQDPDLVIIPSLLLGGRPTSGNVTQSACLSVQGQGCTGTEAPESPSCALKSRHRQSHCRLLSVAFMAEASEGLLGMQCPASVPVSSGSFWKLQYVFAILDVILGPAVWASPGMFQNLRPHFRPEAQPTLSRGHRVTCGHQCSSAAH